MDRIINKEECPLPSFLLFFLCETSVSLCLCGEIWFVLIQIHMSR